MTHIYAYLLLTDHLITNAYMLGLVEELLRQRDIPNFSERLEVDWMDDNNHIVSSHLGLGMLSH